MIKMPFERKIHLFDHRQTVTINYGIMLPLTINGKWKGEVPCIVTHLGPSEPVCLGIQWLRQVNPKIIELLQNTGGGERRKTYRSLVGWKALHAKKPEQRRHPLRNGQNRRKEKTGTHGKIPTSDDRASNGRRNPGYERNGKPRLRKTGEPTTSKRPNRKRRWMARVHSPKV